jgi:hypothetical protein
MATGKSTSNSKRNDKEIIRNIRSLKENSNKSSFSL